MELCPSSQLGASEPLAHLRLQVNPYHVTASRRSRALHSRCAVDSADPLTPPGAYCVRYCATGAPRTNAIEQPSASARRRTSPATPVGSASLQGALTSIGTVAPAHLSPRTQHSRVGQSQHRPRVGTCNSPSARSLVSACVRFGAQLVRRCGSTSSQCAMQAGAHGTHSRQHLHFSPSCDCAHKSMRSRLGSFGSLSWHL